MTNTEHSIEARILQAVKLTLAGVIRDTATPHGMRHPLSDSTIADMRQCLVLISARERELAQEGDRQPVERPRFADEPASGQCGDKVIHFHKGTPSGNPRG